jgi:hypothetical protein
MKCQIFWRTESLQDYINEWLDLNSCIEIKFITQAFNNRNEVITSIFYEETGYKEKEN